MGLVILRVAAWLHLSPASSHTEESSDGLSASPGFAQALTVVGDFHCVLGQRIGTFETPTLAICRSFSRPAAKTVTDV